MTAIPHSNRISIRDFLARRGIQPKYERSGYGMYLSPLREERTPSFKVDYVRNLWYDFGLDKGGDIFTLAGEFIGSNDFMEQVKFIAETANIPMPVPEVSRPTFLPKPSEPVFEGVEAAPLFRSPLTGYLAERGIPYGIASRYCCRLNYGVRGKRYFAVGFPNMAGGFEIRSRFFKGCVPLKDVSLVKAEGSPADVCSVFEGFMDFLSAVTLGLETGDCLVLNSVANVEKAMKYLDGYGCIDCYLDRDEAGRRH